MLKAQQIQEECWEPASYWIHIKQILQDIYRDLGIISKAKATDLEKYFKLVKTKITLPDKKLENGFKLEIL